MIFRLRIWNEQAITWLSRITKLFSYILLPAWTTNQSGFYIMSSSWRPKITFAQWRTWNLSGSSKLRRNITTWTIFLSVKLKDNWNKSLLRLIHDSTKRATKILEYHEYLRTYIECWKISNLYQLKNNVSNFFCFPMKNNGFVWLFMFLCTVWIVKYNHLMK